MGRIAPVHQSPGRERWGERAITASLPGGELHIEWAADDHVHMAGEAVEVHTGVWPR